MVPVSHLADLFLELVDRGAAEHVEHDRYRDTGDDTKYSQADDDGDDLARRRGQETWLLLGSHAVGCTAPGVLSSSDTVVTSSRRASGVAVAAPAPLDAAAIT